jgi:hypothetical protein
VDDKGVAQMKTVAGIDGKRTEVRRRQRQRGWDGWKGKKGKKGKQVEKRLAVVCLPRDVSGREGKEENKKGKERREGKEK